MPTYEYACKAGHHFERVLPVAEYKSRQLCECGAEGRRVLSLPLLHVQRECRYDSPVDGRPITSWKQRREDLARAGCQPYDPGMKQDTDRRVKERAESLERSFDATIEAEIERMPSRKKESLERELTGGADAVPVNTSVPIKTTVEIDHA
jgi:putative FmdB family regulatory protein